MVALLIIIMQKLRIHFPRSQSVGEPTDQVLNSLGDLRQSGFCSQELLQKAVFQSFPVLHQLIF